MSSFIATHPGTVPTTVTATTSTTTTYKDAGAETRYSYERLKALDKQRLIHGQHHPQMQTREIIFAEGHGSILKDTNGNEYIDAKAGLFNTHIGHGRREMADVAAKQITQLQFAQNLAGYSNVPAIMLADKLVQLAHSNGLENMESVFFCSGGSEANESAYHMALRYWELKGLKSKTRVISFNNCYHGSTFFSSSVNPLKSPSYGWDRIMAESTMTGALYDKLQRPFITIDFPNANFFDVSIIKNGETLGQAAARCLEEAILKEGANNICAFIAEPIQGDGGCVIPHIDFWPLAREICTKYGVLLIADEVLTFGKTGKWFAMSHWGVKPDIITVAKGLSSGYLPLGAMMVSRELKECALNTPDKENMWNHDFTYSGHPTCCAIGLKNLEIMEAEGLIPASENKGIRLLSLLMDKLPRYTNVVKEVRGQGMMIGIELRGHWAEEIEDRMAHEERVLVHHSGQNKRVVILSPCLVITEQQIDRLAEALDTLFGKMNLEKRPESK